MREALDLGVNFLDTAAAYGTEAVVGKAIKGRPRDSVVISTKSHVSADGHPLRARRWSPTSKLRCASSTPTMSIIFHLHGLAPKAYDHAMAEIVPALLREKEKGKLRHLAVSETGPRDPEHTMLERASRGGRVGGGHAGLPHDAPERAQAGCWNGRGQKGIGTLCMFAVRNIFSKPDLLQEDRRAS